MQPDYHLMLKGKKQKSKTLPSWKLTAIMQEIQPVSFISVSFAIFKIDIKVNTWMGLIYSPATPNEYEQ